MLSLLALAAVLTAAPDTTVMPQGVNYRIEARLDEAADVLHGRARLRYTNHSSTAIDTLWLYQYLNAFRPNSAWATRELEFGERRFQDLGPNDAAFERFTSVSVGGAAVRPVYPGAPDSTVVGIPLPTPLQQGETTTVMMDWDARPSTLPRRQGRRGRHYDFAQWYPHVAVFENGAWQIQELLPQGEFYGEFSTYDVTLDLRSDQVMAATGVVVDGDPGWEAAAAPGFADSLFYESDAYGSPPLPADALGLVGNTAASGRKLVRWHAEEVHNFAWTTAPDYIYEGGHWSDIAIHVLYQPGDTAWDNGQALRNTRIALQWLDSIYGDFAWPQISNVHRIESGGTEFPMMVMNGGASLGLILHEVGHNYTMGILANNEWKAGYLDEGITSFQTNWYFQTHGQPDVWDEGFQQLAGWERAGRSQPLVTHSADFKDFNTYNVMTYTKPAIVYRMLQAYLGDAAFRAGMRRYYAENKLQHVTLDDFERAMEEASGQQLDWFFDEWFHTVDTLDYAVNAATTAQLPDGRWRTRVEVTRTGEAWMPVEIRVGDQARTLDSHELSQTVEIDTAERPDEVTLDPDIVLLDVDRANNTRKLAN